MDIARLQEKPGSIPGPRRRRGNLRHKREDIPVIGPAALLCNGEDFEDMEAFGQERKAEPRKFLELPEGIPDESTFLRVFRRMHPKELSAYLCMGNGSEGTGAARGEH
ncbi:MAG: transposase family protein [Spirochaetaceae bacterium]|nr:transposase family protein [Spirochaetaceae bacterium]